MNNKLYSGTPLLGGARAALLTSLLFPAIGSWAQMPASTAIPSQRAQSAPGRIENVVHIVGLGNKPGGTGVLAFDELAMTLRVRGRSAAIPLRSIFAFSIVYDDKPLISGTKGKLAEAAPYGVGFAVSMTRPRAETLTIFYRDSDGGIHGGVLVLPKDTGERVTSVLTGIGLSPDGYQRTGNLVPPETHESGIQVAPASRLTKPTVEVALPSLSADGIPSAVPAAVYEDLIAQLARSGRFAHVWRAGDVHRTPGTLVLHVNIENWKRGSARKRALGLFTGATVIKANVKLVDASGRTVFEREIDGAKRMKGENLEATHGLARHVRKALEEAPIVQSST